MNFGVQHIVNGIIDQTVALKRTHSRERRGYDLHGVVSATAGGAGMAGMLAAAPLAVLGGFFWKMMVITRAGYQQGFAMAKIPQRGSGARAAPRLTQPTPRADAAMAGAAAE